MWKTAWEKRHLILALLWVALAIPAFLWWQQSVLFVIILSLYANFEASLAAYNAQKANKEKES